jgi:hypothetical protein
MKKTNQLFDAVTSDWIENIIMKGSIPLDVVPSEVLANFEDIDCIIVDAGENTVKFFDGAPIE